MLELSSREWSVQNLISAVSNQNVDTNNNVALGLILTNMNNPHKACSGINLGLFVFKIWMACQLIDTTFHVVLFYLLVTYPKNWASAQSMC